MYVTNERARGRLNASWFFHHLGKVQAGYCSMPGLVRS